MDINQVGFGIGGDQAYQQSQQNDQQLQMNALTIQQKQQEVDQQQQDADIANQAKTIMSNIALGKGGVGAPQSQGNTAASMQSAEKHPACWQQYCPEIAERLLHPFPERYCS